MTRLACGFFSAVLVIAPLGAKAADLVVWWEKGQYAQEDDAVRETIAAFEQGSGNEVELVFYPGRSLWTELRLRSKAGRLPDFVFGLDIIANVEMGLR